MLECKHSYPLKTITLLMECEGRTTITVSRAVKDRFLGFIGAPKKFSSADEALIALLDQYESEDGKEHGSV